LPAFQQVIQDQAYLGQGSKAKPTYSSVDPHAHWQHNQVSLLSYDVTRMEEFPSVATKFISDGNHKFTFSSWNAKRRHWRRTKLNI
jgi:hypothetical protein